MPLIRVDADSFADARREVAGGVSIALDLTDEEPTPLAPRALTGSLKVIAAGPRAEVDILLTGKDARRIDASGCTLLPGLVNAHTHLDLTHIGPLPFDREAGFLSFVKQVLSQRLTDADAITRSVTLGAQLSLQGGVVAVGDIAGVAAGQPTLAPVDAVAATPLHAHSYLEFFAIGTSELANCANLTTIMGEAATRRYQRVRVGVSPHAPYTVSLHAYEHAVRVARHHGASICTHLAENPEERAFIATGQGPFRDLLDRINLWNDTVAATIGKGATPLAHIKPVLDRALHAEVPVLAAHVNDCDDMGLMTLKKHRVSVVYSPRSSAYFHNHEHFGPHRYRAMLARGINVCLGTDSIINLPAAANPSAARISTWDEMRFLFARDATQPRDLLAMATTNAARALGMKPAAFTFSNSDPLAGLIAVTGSTLTDALRASTPTTTDIQLLALGRTGPWPTL
ncbi:MAG TPA: amidohydrolase family protein [Phycisphaerales bacterium]|nr:amidohydrolase family protein [Phycisphaerales bacterium]